jgi:hypothetical protein
MDSQEGMTRGSKEGPVIVPGRPDESKLIQAIRYADRVKMPPSGKLSDDDIAILESWVRNGAIWGHASTPKAKVAATKVRDSP